MFAISNDYPGSSSRPRTARSKACSSSSRREYGPGVYARELMPDKKAEWRAKRVQRKVARSFTYAWRLPVRVDCFRKPNSRWEQNTVVPVNLRHLFTDLGGPQLARQRVLASRSGDQSHDPLPHEQPYNISRGDGKNGSKPRSVATPFREVPHVPVISRRAEDCPS